MSRVCCGVVVGGCASWVCAAFGIVSVRLKMVVGDGVRVLVRFLAVEGGTEVVLVEDLVVVDWVVEAW